MPDTCFRNYPAAIDVEPQLLLDQADQALAAGDKERCTGLIERLYTVYDRSHGNFFGLALAVAVGVLNSAAMDVASMAC